MVGGRGASGAIRSGNPSSYLAMSRQSAKNLKKTAAHRGRRCVSETPSRLEQHRRHPSEGDQRDVVVQEGGHHAVPDMVVLAIHVEARGRAQGGVRGRGAGIAQGGGGTHQRSEERRVGKECSSRWAPS